MTSNRELLRLSNDAADELNEFCWHMAHGLAHRIDEHTGELRAASMLVRAGGVSDPTALGAERRSKDVARQHLAEMERCLRKVTSAVRRLQQIAACYPEARVANDEDRRHLERLNGTRADGCASCARLSAADGLPRWEPADSRRNGPTDVSGRLSEPLWLCRWCVDRVELWGRLPTPAELGTHHAGQRVPWPADVARPS
jgi:hypothetical protein